MTTLNLNLYCTALGNLDEDGIYVITRNEHLNPAILTQCITGLISTFQQQLSHWSEWECDMDITAQSMFKVVIHCHFPWEAYHKYGTDLIVSDMIATLNHF